MTLHGRSTSEPVTVEEFYERASWPVGTLVRDADDPKRLGAIVRRGGRVWVDRSNVPLVRWDGQIDAVPVAWERLHRA